MRANGRVHVMTSKSWGSFILYLSIVMGMDTGALPLAQRRTFLSLSAFAITETELKLMAAAAIIGFRSR